MENGWLVVGLSWVVCASLAFLISRARGSGRPVFWAGMGLLLGPLGVVLSIFSGPASAARDSANRIVFGVLLVAVVAAGAGLAWMMWSAR